MDVKRGGAPRSCRWTLRGEKRSLPVDVKSGDEVQRAAGGR